MISLWQREFRFGITEFDLLLRINDLGLIIQIEDQFSSCGDIWVCCGGSYLVRVGFLIAIRSKTSPIYSVSCIKGSFKNFRREMVSSLLVIRRDVVCITPYPMC